MYRSDRIPIRGSPAIGWYHRNRSSTVDFGHRQSILTVSSRLREKREISALPWFPARSVARERSFVGEITSPLGEKGRERRRELPAWERGDTTSLAFF
ncbi:hypothetical protein B296_00053536 [Ensete ventricosum]|uniref:Uncharacterized protein n=1 Tax=Ensete ventricosum TaxID=4639 RepID=A0A426Y2J5_ENSVE|nr:hypothetical protein B296_00053536 [Ensete ventricosum]